MASVKLISRVFNTSEGTNTLSLILFNQHSSSYNKQLGTVSYQVLEYGGGKALQVAEILILEWGMQGN